MAKGLPAGNEWLKSGAWGSITKGAYRPKAPRPPTQTTSFAKAMEDRSSRPSLKGMLTERRGRDVGFAKSGFRPATGIYKQIIEEVEMQRITPSS
jgi:hypothetical protein